MSYQSYTAERRSVRFKEETESYSKLVNCHWEGRQRSHFMTKAMLRSTTPALFSAGSSSVEDTGGAR